jgi:hypothetical protein
MTSGCFLLVKEDRLLLWVVRKPKTHCTGFLDPILAGEWEVRRGKNAFLAEAEWRGTPPPPIESPTIDCIKSLGMQPKR